MEQTKRSKAVAISLLIIICILGWGPAVPAAAAETAFSCVLPNSDQQVALAVTLPEGWQRNTAFGTVVFEPGNAGDYFEAPNVEISAVCEGECAPAAIPANIDSFVQRLKEGWKTLATGNADLDKAGTAVEVLKDEKQGNARVFAVSLTYPEGVSAAMYPPRLYIYRFIHDPDEPYFILVKGLVPAALKSEFYTAVEAVCGSVRVP